MAQTQDDLRIEIALRREWQARAEKAEAEVARLQEWIKRMERQIGNCAETFGLELTADDGPNYWLTARADTPAHAEIERLRAALQRIIAEAESDDGLAAWDGADIARAALRDEQTSRRCECGKPMSNLSSAGFCDYCGALWTKAYQAGREFERQYGDGQTLTFPSLE